MRKRIVFLPTEKIGRLTPITSLNKVDKRKRVLWEFLCDCGKKTIATASDVRLGRKLSCGCFQQELRNTLADRLRLINTKPDKDGPLTKLFGNYKRAALRRGYEWHLTKEQFKEFLFRPCFYCGSNPSTEIFVARQQTIENTLIYNGVDRKNNALGYTTDNCITACFVCNRMKMNLSYEDFLSRIKQIYERHT